jgi:CBS domain-containing protein
MIDSDKYVSLSLSETESEATIRRGAIARSMRVADAMTPRDAVVTVSLPGTRDDVLEYLQERTFSSVPVVKGTDDDERYRGLISREDLIEQPDEDQLALLMREVPTVDREAPLTEVARLVVEEATRRIPVVEDGRLAGIVTVTDVVEAIAEGEADGADEVGELARRAVNTTYEGTPLPVCEREISYARVPYALVLDDEGSMSGIITEVDVIEVAEVVEGEEDAGESIANQDDEWMWEGIKAVGSTYVPTRNVEIPQEAVREFMTADPVTVTKRRTAREAAQAMLHHDIEQLPLVSGDSLAGVVRDVDLLRALL